MPEPVQAAAASSSSSKNPSTEPEHRFTLSDYYSLGGEVLDPLRTSSPPNQKAHRLHLARVVASSSGSPSRLPPNTSMAPPVTRPPNANAPGLAAKRTGSITRSRPPPPTIVTSTSPSFHSSPTLSAENTLQLDLFDSHHHSSDPDAARRISPSPSTESLGVMIHPLGPGPEPHPASPDGHASDTEEYMPDITYPPRGHHANHPTHSARHLANAGRDLQREGGPEDRARANSSSASDAYAQLRPANGQGALGLSSSPSQRSLAPAPLAHLGRRPSNAFSVGGISSMSGSSYQPRRAPGVSPFQEDDEKRMEKEASAASTRALATLGPSSLSRNVDNNHPLRDWFPRSWPCRLLLLVVFLESAINIAIQANILWRLNLKYGNATFENLGEPSSGDTPAEERIVQRLPVYLYIFVSAHIIQMGLTIWAVRMRNTIQVIGLAIFNCLFLIYAGIETKEIRDLAVKLNVVAKDNSTSGLATVPITALGIVSCCVIGASVAAVTVLTWYIWREFGWDIYRSLGADLRIRKFYFQYQVFECIICFSFFFIAGFAVQLAIVVLQPGDPEKIATWVMVPVLILWLAMGLTAARFEWRIVMGLFMAGVLGSMAYFIYKLVKMYTDMAWLYETMRKSLTVFAGLSLAMSVLLLVYCGIVFLNFGRGLRHALDSRREERKQERVAMRNTGNTEAAPPKSHRLTID